MGDKLAGDDLDPLAPWDALSLPRIKARLIKFSDPVAEIFGYFRLKQKARDAVTNEILKLSKAVATSVEAPEWFQAILGRNAGVMKQVKSSLLEEDEEEEVEVAS
jgi:hypothetical protein